MIPYSCHNFQIRHSCSPYLVAYLAYVLQYSVSNSDGVYKKILMTQYLLKHLFLSCTGLADWHISIYIWRRHDVHIDGITEFARVTPWTKWPLVCSRHFEVQFYEWKVLYFDLNLTEYIPKGPIDNNSALVQVMAWRRTGDKPLSESILTQFTNAALGGDELRHLNTPMISL